MRLDAHQRAQVRRRRSAHLSAVSAVIEHDGELWTLYGDGQVRVRRISRWRRVLRAMTRRAGR